MKPAVGYIGLGDIGAPMAGRIVPGGFDLVVWNRTAAKMDSVVAAGASAARSPADVASKCDLVCLCIDSAAGVEEVIFGPSGLVHGGRAKLIVDHSTLHPQKAKDLAARAQDVGLRYLDAPVSGGAHGAVTGTLAIMVGGDEADFEIARPVLMAYASGVTHMGGPGSGMASKICNQILLFGTMLAIAESHAMGTRFGMKVERLPEALKGGLAESNVFKEYTRATRAGENPRVSITKAIQMLKSVYEGDLDPEARGNMAVPLKDAGIALELGRICGSPMPLTGLFETIASITHNQKPRDAF